MPISFDIVFELETPPTPVQHIAKWEGNKAETLAPWKWRSKEFVNRVPTSIGALKVDASEYPVTVRLFCDGSLYDTVEVADEKIHRVSAANGLGRKWVIEIEGTGEVDAVYVATTVDEIKGYLGV